MAGTLQPLVNNQKIIHPDGTPTDYFIRWAQQRQIDIGAGITAEQAQQLIDDWAADRSIIAGTGLSGGGTLAADRTIDLADTAVTPGTYGDATHVGKFTVDQQGRITDASSVAISGGGGGGGLPPWVAPVTHVPQISDFIVLNAGTAGTFTTTDQPFGIDFFASDDGGTEQVKALGMSLVDQTFTLSVRMYGLMIPASYSVFGIGVRDSSTGQMVTMCLDCRAATVPRYRVTTRSSFTSAVANPIDLNTMHLCEYFRIVSDGTIRSWEISLDGRQWVPLGTTAISAYAPGADQIMWWVSAADSSTRLIRGSLVDWAYTP